ncbi:hypothetical protein [Leeuwenhoekiella sp. CH_XMU1409-2]|uniref:hypothetical protein n=1 Tax=Leeuwenhoekiella sp. CH_XMU1409-2 TaxID=3107768 RepID=UPI00300B9CF6
MSEFPLNIDPKEDLPEKLDQVKNLDPKYWTSAAEANKMVRALEELNEVKATKNELSAIATGEGGPLYPNVVSSNLAGIKVDNTPTYAAPTADLKYYPQTAETYRFDDGAGGTVDIVVSSADLDGNTVVIFKVGNVYTKQVKPDTIPEDVIRSADTTGDIDDQQGDKVAKADSVFKFVKDEKENLIRDEKFLTFPSATGDDGWRDLVSGNTYTISNGVISLTSVGADQNLSYKCLLNLPKITDTILISGSFSIPSGYSAPFNPSFSLIIGTNLGTTSLEGISTGTSVEGVYSVTKSYDLKSLLPVGVTNITYVRMDVRLYRVNVSFSNPYVILKKDTEYLSPKIQEEIAKTYTLEAQTKVNDLTYEKLFENFAIQDGVNYLSGLASNSNMTKVVTGSDVNYSKTQESGSATFYFNYQSPVNLIANHKYYVVFEVLVNIDSRAVDNNFTPRLTPKFDNPTTIGSAVLRSSIQVGNRGFVKFEMTTNASITEASNKLFFETAGSAYTTGMQFDADFYNVFIADLGNIGSENEVSYAQMDEYFTKYGFVPEVNAITTPVADVSSGGGGSSSLADIEIWSDSLGLSWNTTLATLLGRNVFQNKFGGKKSYYIRDQFLSGLTPERTQVFLLGRNNYSEQSYVLDDLKAMVSALGHQRFVILTVVNGGIFNYEITGNVGYGYITSINEAIKKAFPNNYIDIREGLIERYDFQNVKLTSSFTQPAIDANVQITVNDTTYFATENSSDASALPTRTGQMRIIHAREDLNDGYEIVSIDSETQITIQLKENNSGIAPGATVQNIIDDGSVKYLKLIQELDFYTKSVDTVMSSLRYDNVHWTQAGQDVVANLVAEFIKTAGI